MRKNEVIVYSKNYMYIFMNIYIFIIRIRIYMRLYKGIYIRVVLELGIWKWKSWIRDDDF